VAGQGGVSGTGVAVATAGGILLYAALTGQDPVTALKSVLSGKPVSVPKATAASSAPAAGGATAASSGGSASGIAGAARKYIGRPYRWGAAGPDSFDCSGLVTYVLVHDVGLKNLPNNTHTGTGQFLVWRGAITVSGTPQAGDLICWAGHIAIASGGGRMIEAPGVGKPVRETTIRTAGATIRRVIIADKTSGVPDTRKGGTAF
jgi:cell wall-associated NlpC family hydrolase